MTGGITRLDLRLRSRSGVGYAVGMVLYTLIIIAVYPTFKNDSGLDQLTQGSPTLAAIFGASGSLTSPVGWLNANLYANFLPLMVLVVTLGYGASSIAGQDEDGTLAPVAALPLTRRSLLRQKMAALVLSALPISVLTAFCVMLGRNFDLSVAFRDVVGATTGVLLMAVDFGLLAMAIGAWTGSRGLALGISAAAAAASYLISSLAPVSPAVHNLRGASLFYWAVGDNQLATGLSLTSILVMGLAAATLAAATAIGFERLDLH